MGSRGAASGLRYDKHKGYSSYGKKYGSEYHTVLQVGDIKFIKSNNGNATAPMETRAGHKRIYVTLNNKNMPKFINSYGKNGKRIKQIDLSGHAHSVNGKKINPPHTHLGYIHLEGGTRSLTKGERNLVDKVRKAWDNYGKEK